MKKNKAKLLTVIALSTIGVITAAAIPLSAYVTYNNYYNSIVNNKKDSSDASSSAGEEPTSELVLTNIEAKLKDGVAYYSNNKATPTKDDFIVTAHYTRGTETIDESLFSDQFEMTTPADFYLNGGTIKFSFSGKETSLALTLTPVKIASIQVIADPYKIYYKEGDVFDKTGIKVGGVNNDGSELPLTEDDVVGLETPLTVGQNKAEIHLVGDNNVKGEVNISVVSESEFDDGRLLSIEATEGMAKVKKGASISETDISTLKILRKYESGNKYLSDASKLEVASSGYTAIYGDKKLVTVKVKDTTISTEVPLYIEDGYDFSNADIQLTNVDKSSETIHVGTSSETKEVARFSLEETTDVTKSISFSFLSSTYSSTSLSLLVSNNVALAKDGLYVTQELDLSDLFDIRVNGIMKSIDKETKIASVSNSDQEIASNTYSSIVIKDVNLKNGTNEISLVAKKGVNATVSVAGVSFLTNGDTPNYGFLDYLEMCEDGKGEATYSLVTDKAIHNSDFYNTYAVIADENYYYALQAKSWDGKTLCITKVDKETQEVVKASEAISSGSTSAIYQSCFNIFFNHEGNIAYINPKTNVASVYDKETLEKLDSSITFESSSSSPYLKVSYNKNNDTYAVMFANSNALRLYDRNGKLLDCAFNTKKLTFPILNEFTRSGIAAYNDFIIVDSSKQSGADPLHQIRVYDYEGNLVYSSGDTTFATTGNESKGYALNYIFDGNECYLVTNSWQAGFNLFKVTFNATFAKSFDTSVLGGYVEKANYQEKTAAYTSTILNQDAPIAPTKTVNEKSVRFINIDSTINVGGEIFASYSNGGSIYGVIAKLDLENQAIIQSSDPITLGDASIWSKSNTLFSKDGYIGMVNNRDYSITFYDTETLEKVEKDVVTFSGLASGTKISYITYNDLNKKFALADSANNLYYADEYGKVTGKVGKLNTPTKEDDDTNTNKFKTAQLTCDNGYVYMTYSRDADYNAYFNIYDWNGNFIKDEKFHLNGTIDAKGTDTGTNVQAMVNYNNKLYISVLGYNNKGQFLYEVNFDQTVFD